MKTTIIRLLFFLVILVFGFSKIFGQTFNLEKKADEDFANRDYHFALEFYLKIYDKKPYDPVVLEKIVLCNMALHNFQNVLTWCNLLVRISPNNAVYKLEHARAQHNLGKYVDAKSEYLEYAKLVPSGLKVVREYIRSCDSGLSWSRNPNPRVQIENVKALNTPYDEFGLTKFGKGYMFSSDRINEETQLLPSSSNKKGGAQEIFGFTGRPYLKLYYVSPTSDNTWDQPSFFSKLVSERYHTSSASYDDKNNILYFTRTRKVEIPKSFSKTVFRAELVYSEAFREIKPFPYNSTLIYSVGDPCITSDGKRLYFSSGIPGGNGGADLYYSDLAPDGTWNKPVNLGSSINTEGEERYPTLYNDSTLYFSSDGHTGMGGLDIFTSTLQKNGTWGPVSNLGAPFNSAQDDFFLTISSLKKLPNHKTFIQGFFSSDRLGGMGSDDIYAFKSGEEIKAIPENTLFAKGKIVDNDNGKGVSGVDLSVNEVNNPEINNFKTDSTGSFAFPVKKEKSYAIRFRRPKFFTKSDTIKIENTEKLAPIVVNENMEKIVLDKPIRLENIYYEFNSWVINPKSSYILNGLVKVLKDNPDISVEIDSHTDTRGDFEINKYISQQRAQSVVNYLSLNGISLKRLTAKGYGKERPLIPCSSGDRCTEADQAKNRRTEFKVIKIGEQSLF